MELFLIILALIWLVIASVSDIKRREVFNWINFSLILFALAFRAFYAYFNSDVWYFIWGLIGFGIFFLLANIFYYLRAFAGGDAKLLMALGVVLPFSSTFYGNIAVFSLFILLLMLMGGVYSLLYSAVLSFRFRKFFVKEFKKQIKKKKNLIYLGLIFALVSLFLGFVDAILLLIPGLLVILPFVFIYSKSVEESCMINYVEPKNLTVGDWLYETVKIKGRKIEPYWEGLSEEEVRFLKKNKVRVKIKSGIPFVPSFLLAFLSLLYLRESSWSFFQFFWLF